MLDVIGFKEAAQSWDLPPPGSKWDCYPAQCIEQMRFRIWCHAACFAQADIIRPDATLMHLFDWPKAEGLHQLMALDPSRANAKVTCEVVSVAKSPGTDRQLRRQAVTFLTLCRFSTFASKVGLLPT